MTGRAANVRSNSRSTAGMSVATVAATASASPRDSVASMRRSLLPGTSAKAIPAISRVASGAGSGVAAGVGVGVAVGSGEGSDDAVGRARGEGDGVSGGAVTGPHAAIETRIAARSRLVTEKAYRRSRGVVRILRPPCAKRYDFRGGEKGETKSRASRGDAGVGACGALAV